KAGAQTLLFGTGPRPSPGNSPLGEAAVLGAEDRVAPAVAVLVRLAHRGFVDLDPEARAFGHRQIAVDRGQRRLVGAEIEEVVAAGVVVDAKADFLDRMVGGARRDLQAGAERERPERAVRGDRDV